jgi:hypothetical protein
MSKFEGSIDLCNSSLKSINGFVDRFSINMNNASETIATAMKLTVVEPAAGELLALLLPVSKYVSTSRNELIVIAKVIAPFMSIFLLPYFVLPL